MGSSNLVIYLALSFALNGCRGGDSDNIGKLPISQANHTDTLLYTDSIQLFVSYLDSVNYVFLTKTSNKEHSYDVQKLHPIGLPKVIWASSKWIYLKGGCGSSCTYGYLLSLENGKLKIFGNPLYTDRERKIIVYCNDQLMLIENFSNNKRLEFTDSLLKGPYCGFTIDNFRILNESLLFEIEAGNKVMKREISILTLL
jgi:hypothetical protein